jgi:hypothetical protein
MILWNQQTNGKVDDVKLSEQLAQAEQPDLAANGASIPQLDRLLDPVLDADLEAIFKSEAR